MVKINAGLTATRAERIETMKRQERFPETSVFHFYNENPKNRITGDCTFRAIATALKQGWGETMMEMAKLSLEHGYALDDKKALSGIWHQRAGKSTNSQSTQTARSLRGKSFARICRNADLLPYPTANGIKSLR